MTNDWSDPHLRGTKRALSVYEKSSLLTTAGRALIFPGEPPQREGEVGEIEELRNAGYDPHYIFGVEADKHRVVTLHEYYYDNAHIHFDTAEDFLLQSRGGFSYIHLDFDTQFNADEANTVQAMMNRVAPLARIRISSLLTRRGKTQIEYENTLRRATLQMLCHEAAKLDETSPDRWERYWAMLRESNDSTQLHATLMVLNFFFDINCWSWSDSCQVEPFLPKVKGSHRVTNLQRFTYSEVGGHHVMFTTWCDLVPHHPASIPATIDWTLNELANFFESIVTPISQFIPELFMEAQ